MRPDSRLLVVETVLPGDNAMHFGNLYDMAMLVLVGGQERTDAEYTALVQKAGMKIARILPTTMPPSVIEWFRPDARVAGGPFRPPSVLRVVQHVEQRLLRAVQAPVVAVASSSTDSK